MANYDIVTSKMGGNDLSWRSLTMTVLDAQVIASGATFTTDALFIIDGGFESLQTVIVGATGLITIDYVCDNSNNDANFATPFAEGVSIGGLVATRGPGVAFDVISMAPAQRKKFIFTNTGAGSATVSVYLNLVLKDE